MNKSIIYFLIIFFIIYFLFFNMIRVEQLSLSQFPIPMIKSNNFYTCGKCGYIYQKQNKIGQICDCGGFVNYQNNLFPSCYKNTIDILENFSNNNQYTCIEAAGTFDSGSTFLRNLPCPIPFPKISKNIQLLAHKEMNYITEKDVFQHLENNGLIIAANDGSIVDYTLKKLIEQTSNNYGYPNFYYINGPILVMTKLNNGNYFWMIDYPIKYNPGNIFNYINTSNNWNIAKTAFNTGRKLLNLNAPFFFFYDNNNIYENFNCVYGPEYGSGNWLLRV
jgi:hypothetical protein